MMPCINALPFSRYMFITSSLFALVSISSNFPAHREHGRPNKKWASFAAIAFYTSTDLIICLNYTCFTLSVNPGMEKRGKINDGQPPNGRVQPPQALVLA